jgi:hypothetical protein
MAWWLLRNITHEIISKNAQKRKKSAVIRKFGPGFQLTVCGSPKNETSGLAMKQNGLPLHKAWQPTNACQYCSAGLTVTSYTSANLI